MYKEHRIRARDQHLVYHFILGWLIALLISWMGVFYFQEFRQFDISRVSLSTIETVWSMKELICLLGSLGFQELCCCFIFTFFLIIGEACGIGKTSSDDSKKPLV